MDKVANDGSNGKGNALMIAALDYASRGWSVIPLRPRTKIPAVAWKQYQSRRATADEIRAWWSRWPDANVGIVTGGVSGGLVVVDADDGEAIAAVTATIAHAPYVPPIARTPRGAHYYFRSTPTPRNGARLGGLALDVRGEGGYVVAPPSLHESGHVYAWDRESDPVPLPDELRRRIVAPRDRTAKRTAADIEAAGADEGERHGAMLAVAGRLAADGVALDDALARCLALNAAKFRPPLDEAEVRRVVEDVYTRDGAAKHDGARTIYGAMRAMLADRLAEVRYVPGAHAIAAVWTPTGEAVEWRITSLNDLQMDAVRVVGNLLTFAKQAHSGATERHVLRVLHDMIPLVPMPDFAANEEDEPTRLVAALLHGPIFGDVLRTRDDGTTYTERAPTTLAASPGVYPHEGLYLRQSKGGWWHLLTNLEAASVKVLRDSAEFGRGRKNVTELARLLRGYPGYIKSYRQKFRGHVVNVTNMLADDPPAQSTTGTTGTTPSITPVVPVVGVVPRVEAAE